MNLNTTERNMTAVKKHYALIFHEIAKDKNIDINKENEHHISIWNNDIDYGYDFNFPEQISKEYLKTITIADEKVKSMIDIDFVLDIIAKYCDVNALIMLENMAFVYDEEDEESKARKELSNIYGDEYAYYIGDDCVGVTWVERQTIIINISEIIKTLNSIGWMNDDFENGLMSTIFHELRHLIYECNPCIEFGDEDYPVNGGEEDNVEMYGRWMADTLESKYLGNILI